MVYICWGTNFPHYTLKADCLCINGKDMINTYFVAIWRNEFYQILSANYILLLCNFYAGNRMTSCIDKNLSQMRA